MTPEDRARAMLRDIENGDSPAEAFQNHYGEELDAEAEARSARRYRMELNEAAEAARDRS